MSIKAPSSASFILTWDELQKKFDFLHSVTV
jgi:hypothetical protein